MGKRGPAGTPTELRVLRGDRKDRINLDEPKPSTSEVVAPDWLPARAREIWDRLAPDLIRKRVLTAWDVDAFADLCAIVVVNQDALADLDRSGMKCTTLVRELSDGTMVYDLRRNPAWQVARESSALIVTLGSRFGLNPADRAQLKMSDGSAPGQDLLSG